MRKQVLLAVALAAALVVAAVAWAADTAVVTSGSGKSWPRTYVNGPLGNNEVLPAVKGHKLLALWSGGAGKTETQQRSLMQHRIMDMGRVPDVIGFSCSGGCRPGSAGTDLSSTDLAENWIHSLGAIPFVANWDAGSSTDFAGIAAGHYDSAIDSSAKRFKNYGHRIMVRMFPEFDNHPWNTTDFINAWRHVVSRFQADGATNVGFWWCPGEQADGGGRRAQINASYPGDQYVDWVGSDSYNGDTNTASSATRNGWTEFSWNFNYTLSGQPSMEQQWGPKKPFFVGETGSKYDTAGVPSGHTVDRNRKKNWFINVASAAAQMPYLIGVDFFDQDVHIFESGNNWRVDSPCDSAGNNCTNGSTDANTYSGFLSMADSSQFSGGVAGGNS
jgi:beta-mannanase